MSLKEYLNTPIQDVVFNVFDTESTGNNSFRQDKPIELAVVGWSLRNGFVSEPKSWLINPQIPIHPAAIMVHGLLDKDVVNCPLYEEIVPHFLEYVKEGVLVAHNIDFDLGMVPEVNNPNYLKLDMLRLSRKVFKKNELGHNEMPLTSHKIQEIRWWLNVEVDTLGFEAHRAVADILVTTKVFEYALKRAISFANVETLEDLLDFTNAPVILKEFTFGKFKGQSIEEAIKSEFTNKNKNYFHYIFSKIDEGSFNISEDELNSIKYYMKKNNISLEGYSLSNGTKVKDWKDFSKSLEEKN
jgi:exodeoxyribonuclease X